jgi:hypothetical protein
MISCITCNTIFKFEDPSACVVLITNNNVLKLQGKLLETWWYEINFALQNTESDTSLHITEKFVQNASF